MEELIIAAGRLAVLSATLDSNSIHVKSMTHSSIKKFIKKRPDNLRKVIRWAARYKQFATEESKVFPRPNFDFTKVDFHADEAMMIQVQKLDSTNPKTNIKRLYSYFYNRGVPLKVPQIRAILVHLIETRDLVHPVSTAEYCGEFEVEPVEKYVSPYSVELDRVVGVSHVFCFALGDHTLVPVCPTPITINYSNILLQAAPLTQTLAATPTPGSYYIIPTRSLSVIYGTVLVTSGVDLSKVPVMTV